MANTANTFLVLWGLEKYSEVHFSREFDVWFYVLVMAGIMYKAALWLHAHPTFVVSLFSSFERNPDAQVFPLSW